MKGVEEIDTLIKGIAVGLEVAGVAVIVLGAIFTSAVFLKRFIKERGFDDSYHRFRSDLGKAILLGLEFLVAGDIVGTVAVGPTLSDLGVLGLLVVIRTFLSFALEMEITGRFPWQGKEVPAEKR